MAQKLPWDLEEEILSRLPPRSLVRFKAVCEQWNAVFNDKWFLNNHFGRAHPHFIFLTDSKTYSIEVVDLAGVDPTINVHELGSDFPSQPTTLRYTTVMACDGLLFRDFWRHGVSVWNPWLRQVRWKEYKDKNFCFCGVGYDNSSRSEKGYKILGFFICYRIRVSDHVLEDYLRIAIYDCDSQTFKFIDVPDWTIWIRLCKFVSLNGNLYWTACNSLTCEYFIVCFDFSKEILKPFCRMPVAKKVSYNTNSLLLTVYKGDRFALLEQCWKTRKVDIWVTKKKIDDDDDVVWLKFMTLSIANFPTLGNKLSDKSFFIYQKTLIMCCEDDEIKAASIFIAKGDMCKKIEIDSSVVKFSHCLYLPTLFSLY